MFEDRLYIPHNARNIFLTRLHQSHQGIEKTIARAKQIAWWPGMTVDIEKFISKCNVCIKLGTIKHQPYFESPLPYKQFHVREES